MAIEIPYELILGVGAATGFALALRHGPGLRLLMDDNGRVLLGALGFLIALGSYALWKRDLSVFLEMGLWFMACCLPVLISGVLSGVAHRERLQREYEARLASLTQRHAADTVDAALAQHTVTDIGHARTQTLA